MRYQFWVAWIRDNWVLFWVSRALFCDTNLLEFATKTSRIATELHISPHSSQFLYICANNNYDDANFLYTFLRMRDTHLEKKGQSISKLWSKPSRSRQTPHWHLVLTLSLRLTSRCLRTETAFLTRCQRSSRIPGARPWLLRTRRILLPVRKRT